MLRFEAQVLLHDWRMCFERGGHLQEGSDL
jgi:hypothetical protein